MAIIFRNGESYTHVLSKITKYLIIDGQVCFHIQLFTNVAEPQEGISWPSEAVLGLHAVPNCF